MDNRSAQNSQYSQSLNQGFSTRPKRPYDPTDNKTRGYRNSYAIYPDYWKQSWGQRPCLGYVRADSVFHARYAAYDAGLLPRNDTFGPEPVIQIRRYQPQSQ